MYRKAEMATGKSTAPTFVGHEDHREIPQEPNWLTGYLGNYPYTFAPLVYNIRGFPEGDEPVQPADLLKLIYEYLTGKYTNRSGTWLHGAGKWGGRARGVAEVDEPVQQADLTKPLMMDIARYGLTYAFYKYLTGDSDPSEKKYQPTQNPKHMIVVGAGIAGLAAAYELAQVGHSVTIVEMQTRFGGRVKTFNEKDGFAKGLYVDGGAMRLPCAPTDPNKTHFLTDFYASTRFKLPLVPFVNSDDNAFLKFYNMERVQIKDWDDSYFTELWPGWNAKILSSGLKISNIETYYSLTTGVITLQLRRRLAGLTTSSQQVDAWDGWINTWSQFSVEGFLRSTVTAIKAQVSLEYYDGLDFLEGLLPWPEAALTCYSVFMYTEQLDTSLVQYLRDQLGEWWSDNMHRISGGMSKLPEKFVAPNTDGWNPNVHLHDNIVFNVTVNEIEFNSPPGRPRIGHKEKVTVKGYYSSTGRPYQIEGDAVIVTAPINILRQIKFREVDNTPKMPNQFYKAIEDIWYGPSTKIMLQTKTRFWETKYNIQGGFSRTSIPIGQIHYPSNPGGNSIPGERGILLCYTWKTEALLFGSLNPVVALYEAVRQLSEIHPEIVDEFETGAIESWYNEPSAQGAYALLKPTQFQNVRWLMFPWTNVYFAGEAISTTSGWIQGALQSGLRAAYQFYARNEAKVAVPGRIRVQIQKEDKAVVSCHT